MLEEVVITGIGVVSCLGTGADKVAESLREGRSGIALDARRHELGFRSALTAKIDDFEPPRIDRKARRTMPEFVLHGYAAALEAIEQAGWTDDELHSTRTGLIVGNDTSTLDGVEQVDTVRREKSTFPIGASTVFRALTSTASMNLNVLLGNRGASWTLAGACASGGHAIGQAADLIAMGRQDRILCGGVQEINWESVASFDATNAFSLREDSPEEASRPFDADRDGLVPGGGAAIVALESLCEARRRGAQVLGRVRGYGFSSDGSALAVPSGHGLAQAMLDCLDRARLEASQVSYVCAHATSTPVGDAAEVGAIARVFGPEGPWVSSTKSLTGHEMWMSGAAQVVYSVLMARDGFIAGNRNFVRQEPDALALRIPSEAVDERPKRVLCNSAGFGGTNSCLLLDFA